MHRLYILRLIGDYEVRYVGQTTQQLQERLRHHVYFAQSRFALINTGQWLRENAGKIEIIQFDEAPDLEAARVLERDAMRLFYKTGHGLLNVAGLRGYAPTRKRPATITDRAQGEAA